MYTIETGVGYLVDADGLGNGNGSLAVEMKMLMKMPSYSYDYRCDAFMISSLVYFLYFNASHRFPKLISFSSSTHPQP